MTTVPDRLARRLGTGDAVVVGLCAMIGAGVFAVFPPAARAAGSGLLLALGLAAVVAFCNATASAQLAAAHPSSGGTYLFGREVLGPWWGFLAGWGFVVGKTASCAAMALTFAWYVVPGGGLPARLLAVAGVALLTLANLRGITRTAIVARVLLGVVLAVLTGFLVITATAADRHPVNPLGDGIGGAPGVLQASGLLFFAFAGYARIATLSEEVERPEAIGRAVVTALGLVVLLYLAIGLALLSVLGPQRLAQAGNPITLAVRAVGADWTAPLVVAGAAAACLGALLALLAGVGRTTLAMARNRDLPGWLASVEQRHSVPDHAQWVIGALVGALVLAADLRSAIGFSSFGVLVYYAIANLSALRQPAAQRSWPAALHLLGLAGCLVLALSLPDRSVLAGSAVLAIGVAGRWLVIRRRP